MVGDLAAAVALGDFDAAGRGVAEDVFGDRVPSQGVDVRVLEEQQPLRSLAALDRLAPTLCHRQDRGTGERLRHDAQRVDGTFEVVLETRPEARADIERLVVRDRRAGRTRGRDEDPIDVDAILSRGFVVDARHVMPVRIRNGVGRGHRAAAAARRVPTELDVAPARDADAHRTIARRVALADERATAGAVGVTRPGVQAEAAGEFECRRIGHQRVVVAAIELQCGAGDTRRPDGIAGIGAGRTAESGVIAVPRPIVGRLAAAGIEVELQCDRHRGEACAQTERDARRRQRRVVDAIGVGFRAFE